MTDTPETDPNVAFGKPDLWEDEEAARKVNGLYANRAFVQPLGQGMLRLNFGEILDDGERTYHTAIVVTFGDALRFAELIHRMALTLVPPPPVITPTVPPPPNV